MRKVVVLPAPLGPSRPKQQPRWMFKVEPRDSLQFAVCFVQGPAHDDGVGLYLGSRG